MKRAFTLIELLVVIAIIAILAAILFPVFAQAKLAAKKTQGLSQAKQIGTAVQLYVGDSDDVLFPYRFTAPRGTFINPSYLQAVAQGNPNANTIWGDRAKEAIFFNQLLFPYTKNDDMWKAPTKSGAWVNGDVAGADTEPPFRSYGGQNSYGVNNYLFSSQIINDGQPSSAGGLGLPYGTIAEVSNTLLLVDASYYNVLPRFPARLTGYTGNFNPCNASSYANYWRSLGNSNWFRWSGNAAARPTVGEALRLIEQRYNGVLNVVRADASAKAFPDDAVMNDMRDKLAQNASMWDPYKQGGTPCPADNTP